MKGYTYLALTIIFETAAIILMKLADGTQNKIVLTIGGICYLATFILLTLSLKYLPIGYTNAVWAGSSTFFVYLIGATYFKEGTNVLEAFFILCILIGIIGLNYLQKGK